MKALSVKQPYASLLVVGDKTIEVRSWRTDYRGPLLICASAMPKAMFWYDKVDEVERLMHAGCMIGIVNLLDVREFRESDCDDAWCDHSQGAYAWVVEPVSFVRPDKILGKLNLFDVDDSLIQKIDNEPNSEWLYSYPFPQGDIKFNPKKHDVLM